MGKRGRGREREEAKGEGGSGRGRKARKGGGRIDLDICPGAPSSYIYATTDRSP